MSFNIALNFEDGVTRFISCNAGEKILDAAYRQKVNLPMDCSDGVCGTCKCHCASGEYALGEDYLEEALSEEETEQRQVLTCQMVPHSDCVIDVPVSASACKTGIGSFQGSVIRCNALSPSAIEMVVEPEKGIDFLPGQYVNIQVPGTAQVRAYSFSSLPGDTQASFLIRNVPDGLMSTWLSQHAKAGEPLTLTGPMGSFYLRPVQRPIVMLAGGTGLAPFLAMLKKLAQHPVNQPITLLYGVTKECDLVMTETLDELARQLTNFSWLPVVTDAESACAQKGFVTDHFNDALLNEGDVDVYLCGPPPMVDAVLRTLQERQITPASFHYEKFAPGQKAEQPAAA
ncbi:benzoate 1,2-dioxygenase electron transfer component BenC [Buttiauxella sp. A111]|uniref:benzoate 1,2-dioxygenase electron transfer component BenC n=1 Tax=Buttiauxella sp. A111 TaxID=2563088 RepID=UPI0010DC6672|nr:benzoate 1,2-dioxygenase electron transfer component BenC [Buttiauxella sp. A111]GDX03977.1 2-polyprenylphenol hydroxylase [Buttiauxella sp. A111]